MAQQDFSQVCPRYGVPLALVHGERCSTVKVRVWKVQVQRHSEPSERQKRLLSAPRQPRKLFWLEALLPPLFKHRNRMEEEQDFRQTVLKSTIEEVRVRRQDDQVDRQTEPCVICLDSVSERAVAFPCRHQTFDFLCLLSWLQQRSTCPLCLLSPSAVVKLNLPANGCTGKAEVNSVQYNWKSLKDFQVYEVDSDTKHRTTPSDDIPIRPANAQSHSRRRPRPRPTWRTGGPRYQRAASPDGALLRRRHVYRHKLYSLHVGSNRLSRFRDLTPTLFSRDAELVSRARKWIRRELHVFEYLSFGGGETDGNTRKADNAEFLLEYIIAILKTVDIKGSGGQAEDMLQDFLGRDNTRLFLHELSAYLRSPYSSLPDWDRHVQYGKAPDTALERKVHHPTYDHQPPVQRSGVAPYGSGISIPKRPCDRYSSCRSHHPPRATQRLPSDMG